MKSIGATVISFKTKAQAAKAFDVLLEGGQYAIVGKLTYAVTVKHLVLLEAAGIPYERTSPESFLEKILAGNKVSNRKLDPDVLLMSEAELRQEVMRLRTAFRKELACTGNRRCWITLLEATEGRSIAPLSLPRVTFLENCGRYYDRNNKRSADLPVGRQKLGSAQRNRGISFSGANNWLPNEDVPMTMRLRLRLANLTLEEAAKKSEQELLGIKYFGKKSLAELKDILKKRRLPQPRPC